MATRAIRSEQFGLVKTYSVPSGKAVTKGKRVKFSGADDSIEDCGAGDNGFAIALEPAAALGQAQVLLEGSAVVPVLVGTGGATRGAHAVPVADGFTDKTLGGGSTVANVSGKFMQTGVKGDYVGLLVGCPVSSVSA